MRELLARVEEEQRVRLAESDAELKQREHMILMLRGLISEQEGGPPQEALQTSAHVHSLSLVPPPRVHRSGPPASNHPFPRRVGNVRAWCREANVSYSLAKSWYNGPKPRAIPRKWAMVLLVAYKIPLSSWRGGISDDPRAGREWVMGRDGKRDHLRP